MHVDTIAIYPVDKVPRAAFVSGLNAAYIDYYVPISMTAASFADFVIREAVRLDASAAALDGEVVVGMGMLAVRGPRGWIGGMGVRPEYRRRGIGRRIMHYLLDHARQLGVAHLQLEVITQNQRAYALYHSLGFHTRRRLLVLQRDDNVPPPPAPSDASPAIEECAPIDLLPLLPPLQTVLRPWQRETSAIDPLLDRMRGLAAYDGQGAVVGACLFSVNTGRIGLFDLAALTPDAGRALLAHLYRLYPHASTTYINLPQDDPMLPALVEAEFNETLSQYEMVYSFTPPHAEPDQE
jgi:ribosomal protein S18 acetylase RimI-like enzyme